MNATRPSREASVYYPPRAGWGAPLRLAGRRFLWQLGLERHLPRSEVYLTGLVAGFLVPGLAVYLSGPKWLGRVALGCSGLLLAVFIVLLGYPAATIAFSLLLSLHVSGLVYYCRPLLEAEALRLRLAVTVLVLLSEMLLVYNPAQGFLQRHVFMPLTYGGKVVVVRRGVAGKSLRAGDWVAYAASGLSGQGVRLLGGTDLGQIVALPGDRVDFGEKGLTVNGRWQPSVPHLPTSGTLVLPENRWLLRPNLQNVGHGGVAEANIAPLMLQACQISEAQMIGVPFRTWFGRRQILP